MRTPTLPDLTHRLFIQPHRQSQLIRIRRADHVRRIVSQDQMHNAFEV
jgi:hypothetical protein